MKKKGNALIMVLCVIMILTALTLSLVQLSNSAYTITTSNEKVDKISNMAMSGIEKGLTALKQTIYNTPQIFTSTVAMASTNFNFTEDVYNVAVTFLDIPDYTENSVDEGPCLKITSTATNTSSHATKTMIAYILKSDISNVYYDTIFGNAITTLDSVNGNTQQSFYMQNSLNPLILDGNMYLQGGEININPYSFNYISGAININSNILKTNTSNTSLVTKMYVNPATSIPSQIASLVQPLSPDLLHVLSIKYNTPYDGQLSDFYASGYYTNSNSNYTVKACQQTTTNAQGLPETTLVTFKITKKNTASATVFDWPSLVTNVKDYIMRNMIKVYSKTKLGSPYDYSTSYKVTNVNGTYCYTYVGPIGGTSGTYGDVFENAYKGMYKLYIIDGDVNIYTSSSTSSYINHVIYCTGKCTLSQGPNPYIIFQNSSIMAKQVVVNDLRTSSYSYYYGTTYTYNNLELHGIKKLNEIISNGDLSPFSAGNRACINQFLIEHLDGYATALRFKVHKWEEH